MGSCPHEKGESVSSVSCGRDTADIVSVFYQLLLHAVRTAVVDGAASAGRAVFGCAYDLQMDAETEDPHVPAAPEDE